VTQTPPPTGRGELDDDVENAPSLDDLFVAPRTRREARERAERDRHDNPLTWHEHGVVDADAAKTPKKPKKKRRWIRGLIVTVVILGMLGGAGAFAWNTFQPQVQNLIALTQPNDYTGNGTGSVTITIKDGDTGGDVATTLQKAGVTKTYNAFYKLLLATVPAPVFQPGVYTLKKQMSAKAALSALEDPKSRLTRTVAIPEGTAEKSILASVAQATKIPLAELQRAAATPAAYGLPAQAKTLEGFLFPATYTFDPGVTAHEAIKTMVDRSFQSLDNDGVPAADRWRTVVLASIVQKEAGPNPSDFGKIARVFDNRLAKGWHLQSDATVAYGTGKTNSVFTTEAQREDASDPYNTYARAGLPIGPISNPGDVAIKAALNPTPGPWMYFVAVNLQTGETVFSTTAAEHDAAVQKLQQWCAASSANGAYCN
jgi:conserved hypothetical protein, YceG family